MAGTTHRILVLIVALQLFTIVFSQGNVIFLGEAYAFGVVWSFVFQAFSMVVLRFKDTRPREFRVPLNLKLGKVELPIGPSHDSRYMSSCRTATFGRIRLAIWYTCQNRSTNQW